MPYDYQRADETLDEVRTKVMQLRDRAVTRGTIDQAIWKIFAYARDHRDDMDSERQCAAIRHLMEQAVTKVQLRLEALTADLEAAHAARKKAEKEKRALKSELRELSRHKLSKLKVKEYK